jgi:hypothetical protein
MLAMLRSRCAVAAILCLLFPLAASSAAPDPAAAIAAGERNTAADNTRPVASSATSPTTALPSPPVIPAGLDELAKASYSKSLQGYYDYVGRGYLYRTRVFEWQMLSSRLIFGIVILLVLAGLGFAGIQFYVAMVAAVAERHRQERGAAKKPVASASTDLASEIGISDKGITVKSSVLGVVILALSLAFFYLYLVYVYPIHEVI